MHSLALLVLAAAAVSAQTTSLAGLAPAIGSLPSLPAGFSLEDRDDSWLVDEVFQTVNFFINEGAEDGAFLNKQTDQTAKFNLRISSLQNKHATQQFASGINPGSPEAQAQDQRFNDFIANMQQQHQEQITRSGAAHLSTQDKEWVNKLTRQGTELMAAIKHEGLELVKLQKQLGNLEAEEQEIKQKAYLYQNKYQQAFLVYSATPAPPKNIRIAAKKRYLQYLRLFDRANESLQALDNRELRLKDTINHEETEIGYMLALVAGGASTLVGAMPQLDESAADPDQPGVPSDDGPNAAEDLTAEPQLW